MLNAPITANWNGEIMPLSKVRIPATDRGFLFGDAIYEVLRVVNNKLWLVDRHLTRLSESLAGVRIEVSVPTLQENMAATLRAAKIGDGLMYIQITRGSAPRKHKFPDATTPNTLIYLQPLDPNVQKSFQTNGVNVVHAADIRWQRRDLKTTNLLPNCLLNQWANENNCQEALLTDDAGFINEGTHTNFFAVINDKLFTAPTNHKILPGITRSYLLHLAHQLHIPFQEQPVNIKDKHLFTEAFITGTITSIAPILKIDDYTLPTALQSRPITLKLISAFNAALHNFSK